MATDAVLDEQRSNLLSKRVSSFRRRFIGLEGPPKAQEKACDQGQGTMEHPSSEARMLGSKMRVQC